jgi:ABC-type multidrug transport system ATPase subunit
MKPVLKAPGTRHLKPRYDELLLNVAFKFNLRRYTSLTAREHLYIYARFRGMPERDIDAEVDRKIASVGLTSKAECAAGTLSGGQKRKLSVAGAYTG